MTISTRVLSFRYAVLTLAIAASFIPPANGAPATVKDWTIMVYLNAKNNLEPDGIQNFYEMASRGSSQGVNILVEMGRPKAHYTDSDGAWSGVLRFKVEKDMTPTKDRALMNLGNADMGSAKTLGDFVSWARAKYPARRYMLIIWNHGQGWRFQLAAARSMREAAARNSVAEGVRSLERADVPSPNGFKSVSYDEDTRNILYNRDIQDTLQRLLPGTKLDVIGFDACLMSMIETAYAMRNVAATLIGSEELEPGAGWPYKDWVASLSQNPQIDGRALAKVVVDSYAGRYGDSYMTTLSGLDLTQITRSAADLSSFANAVIPKIASQAPVIRKARDKCNNYGEAAKMHNPVDLALFLEQLSTITPDTSIKNSANHARESLKALVVANYASKRIQGAYGSNGVSIYFPASKAFFDQDTPDNQGYELNNTVFPVEFVQKETWAKLLHEYFKYQ